MRRSISLSLIVFAVLLSGAATAADVPLTFGKGVSAPDTVLISQLMAHPEAFVGQAIRIEGTAVAVCEHRGCWVNLASDEEGQTVRVKVKDGEIVFPRELVGEIVLAEGVWTARKLDLEQTRKVCAFEAKQDGRKCDTGKITAARTIYQLQGTGARVVRK